MLHLDRHLRYLLRRHDCVTVPGLGAFIASYCPAWYDEASHCYMPPMRSLCFNAEVSHNDGLLVASVAAAEGVGCDRAAGLVAEAVEAVHNELLACGQWAFERVGTLRRADSGALEFTPAADCAVADRYALLPVVDALVPLQAEAPAEEEAPDIPAVLHVRPRRRILTRVAGIAASVAVCGTLVWSALSLLPTRGDANRDTAALAIAAPAPRPADLLLGGEPELFIAIPKAEEAPAAPVAIPAAPVSRTAAAAAAADGPSQPYCLVVASLPTRALAEKQIRAFGDPSLRILESDGRFRVYAATGATFEEAEARKADVQKGGRYPDAWVCRR